MNLSRHSASLSVCSVARESVCLSVCLCVALLWVAPEVLRSAEAHKEHFAVYGSREADVYSFAVIMQEIATSEEPYSTFTLGRDGQSVSQPCR